jgi:hypothetical protein
MQDILGRPPSQDSYKEPQETATQEVQMKRVIISGLAASNTETRTMIFPQHDKGKWQGGLAVTVTGFAVYLCLSNLFNILMPPINPLYDERVMQCDLTLP